MGAVYFYHLTRRPLDAVLPMLLERAIQSGWRVAVRGTDTQRLAWLDEKLWLGAQDSFLPHGLAGGAHDALQPVLLTTDRAAGNDPACIMAIDGAEVDADEVKAAQRVCILFDGQDDAALKKARGQWKALTDAKCSAQYWSEESGRWEKKAENG